MPDVTTVNRLHYKTWDAEGELHVKIQQRNSDRYTALGFVCFGFIFYPFLPFLPLGGPQVKRV